MKIVSMFKSEDGELFETEESCVKHELTVGLDEDEINNGIMFYDHLFQDIEIDHSNIDDIYYSAIYVFIGNDDAWEFITRLDKLCGRGVGISQLNTIPNDELKVYKIGLWYWNQRLHTWLNYSYEQDKLNEVYENVVKKVLTL